MLDLMTSLNNSVKALQDQGVNKIILTSHLGYTLEQEVAAKVPGIDVIVGGHSPHPARHLCQQGFSGIRGAVPDRRSKS